MIPPVPVAQSAPPRPPYLFPDCFADATSKPSRWLATPPERRDNEESPAPAEATVAALIEVYLLHLDLRVQSGDFSSDGLANVRRDLRRFAAWKPGKLIKDCRRQDLLDWLAANPRWKSNSTKKRNLAQLSACFAWAAEEEWISKNPYRKPRSLKLRTRRRADADPGHYVVFLRMAGQPLRRVLYFLWHTGCRPSEARKLTWPMIFWDQGVIIQDDHKAIRLQREPRPRIIGLDPCLLRLLRNLWRQRLPGQDHVFVNGHGKSWTKDGLDRNFRRCRMRILRNRELAERYQMHEGITVYSFRHGYVTEGIQGGIGERQIADQIGHTDTRMIQHYSHAARKSKHLRRVAEEIHRQRRRIRRDQKDCAVAIF